jgi:hypothetical protein
MGPVTDDRLAASAGAQALGEPEQRGRSAGVDDEAGTAIGEHPVDLGHGAELPAPWQVIQDMSAVNASDGTWPEWQHGGVSLNVGRRGAEGGAGTVQRRCCDVNADPVRTRVW